MAESSTQRAQLLTEIHKLLAEQSETLNSVTFVGWTRKEDAAYGIRGERLTLLLKRLATLDSAS